MSKSGIFYCALDFRTPIEVAGDDRRDFLQNLITNDIDLAVEGRAIYACLLTPQGKFLHDFIIINDAGQNRYLLLCEAARADDLLRRLTLYKLRAKVALKSLKDELQLWFHWGEGAADGIADPRHDRLGRWTLAARGGTPSHPGGTLADWAAYNRHRISLCIPEGSLDLEPERSTLLDFGIDRLNGISWTKGCYTGQEVTARMNYRGLVRRHLAVVETSDGRDLPPAGTDIRCADDLAGVIKSAQNNIGLALINGDKMAPGAEAGDQMISICKL